VAVPASRAEVHEYLSKFTGTDSDRPEFAVEQETADGLAVRLIAARTHAHDFGESIRSISAFEDSADARDAIESDLYGFCCNGLSALNCAFLLAYAIGHELNASLPWGTAVRQYPRDVESKFRQYFPKETVTQVMTDIITSGELAHLQALRNSLDHRTAFAGSSNLKSEQTLLFLTPDDLDTTLPTSTPPKMDFDPVTRTDELIKWLDHSIDQLTDSLFDDLVTRR
jgi:hypothetical protein